MKVWYLGVGVWGLAVLRLGMKNMGVWDLGFGDLVRQLGFGEEIGGRSMHRRAPRLEMQRSTSPPRTPRAFKA